MRSRLRDAISALVGTDPFVTRLAVLLAALIALAAGLHLGQGLLDSADILSLDRERGPAAVISAAMLAAAGIAVWLCARRRLVAVDATVFASLLLFMAADEVLEWHETLEDWSGVDWQLLYAPLFLLGAVSGVVLWHRLRRTPAGPLLFGGGVAWTMSQLLEAIQWDGDTPVTGYRLYMPAEELLEMTGSSLFLLSAVLVLRGLPTGVEAAHPRMSARS